MALIDWPTSLPPFVLQQGYQETFADGSIRTSMEVGPAKVRQRTLASAKPYTVLIFLTVDQTVTLENFYKNTLGQGSLPFNFLDPRTAVVADFRFTGPPKLAADGVNFIATCAVEKLP